MASRYYLGGQNVQALASEAVEHLTHEESQVAEQTPEAGFNPLAQITQSEAELATLHVKHEESQTPQVPTPPETTVTANPEAQALHFEASFPTEHVEHEE